MYIYVYIYVYLFVRISDRINDIYLYEFKYMRINI